MSTEPLLERTDQGGYLVWCPGCEMHHVFGKTWEFNGDMKKPTFTPSLMVSYGWTVDGVRQQRQCHSRLIDGEWQFLNDCTHKLAGQTVPLTPLIRNY